MKEISLNILDIAQNSIKAGATLVEIVIEEDEDTLVFTIHDNGCGMKPDFLKEVVSPFATTRKTRKVGLGIPLLKMSCEMTGGTFAISSKSREEYDDHGTSLSALFRKDSIDCVPLGNVVSTICILIHGMGAVDLQFSHKLPGGEVVLSTREMRQMLGEDIPLDSPDILGWVEEYLNEMYQSVSK